MAQLDIYENLDSDSCAEIPFLLDIQHELHQNLRTRMIIPLVRTEVQKSRLDALCPRFIVEGMSVFASVPEMSAYPAKELGGKVHNLEAKRNEIFSAVDFLLNVFRNSKFSAPDAYEEGQPVSVTKKHHPRQLVA